MGVYRAPDVSDQPFVSLERWRIFRVPEGDFHLCGIIPASGHDGRVSSKLVQFDPKTLTGTTQSGRMYKLAGDTGEHRDAAYIRDIWLRVNRIDPNDVTFVTPDEVVLEGGA